MESKDDSKRPADSDWKQQRLPAWQPLLTPPKVIVSFSVICVVFIVVGVIILEESRSVIEIEARYDHKCEVNGTTNITFILPDDMDSTVYFYFKLTNYFQNHRRYVKSRDDKQLRGEISQSVELCDPIERNPAEGDKVIYPCGLIANSYFNDTFEAYYDGAVLDWTNKSISWKSDRDDKFKHVDVDPLKYTTMGYYGNRLPRVDEEEFIVWMRTAGLPTFRKLHRKIHQRLEGGKQLVIVVNCQYKVSDFGGEKHVVLSTMSGLGGKNDFLAWTYIVVGIVCGLLAGAFALKHFMAPRKPGDMQYFHWSRHEQSSQ